MIHPVYRVAQKSIYRKKFEYPHSVLIKWAVFLSMIEESSKFLYIRKTLKNASLNYNFWLEYRNLIFYDILWTVFWKHVHSI
jgi:hypothetical protein